MKKCSRSTADGLGDAGDGQRRPALLAAVVGQRGQVLDVIEVGVAHQHRLDPPLLLQREHAGDRARVERHAPVEEEARRLVLRSLAAVAPEDAQLHQASPNFSRISRKA
ncbi:MAG: hypothetical protein M5U28_42850 [Sandaracinaceae bacterium]|nr:hypothetical protein [Sandaracinaceae bacterium]